MKILNFIRGKNDSVNDQLEIIKGICILCVVIAHNAEIIDLLPRMKIIFQSFDVFCFFLITFCFPSKKFTWEFLRDRIVRYMVPFFWFYTVAALLYNLLIINISVSDFISNYFLGLFVLSAPYIKNAAGFSLYWFLPCYLVLVVIRSLSTLNPKMKYFLVILGIASHLYYIMFLPLSVSVAFFCYPVCMLFEAMWHFFNRQTIDKQKTYNMFSFLLFIISLAIIGFYQKGMYFFVWELPNIFTLHWLIIRDIIALSCIPALIFLTFLLNLRCFILLGKYAMGIYLIHNLIYYAVKFLFNNPINQLGPVSSIFTIPLSISGSILITFLINKISIAKKLIFPRNINDFKTLIIS